MVEPKKHVYFFDLVLLFKSDQTMLIPLIKSGDSIHVIWFL